MRNNPSVSEADISSYTWEPKKKEGEDFIMAKKTWNEETEKNVQGIVNAKSKWAEANDAGDEDGMKEAAESAKGYYKSLTDSGNYDIAKELQASDYDKARGYLDNYMGTKPVDTNRGMALENTRTATDTVKKQSDFAGRSADAIFAGYENQEDRINSNPMDTDAAKAIMERYRGLGEDARGDTLADGSVRNDGNLDSFTKANADRQRQAYEEAGIESVFDLHERNVDAGGQNYRDLQSGIQAAGDVYNNTVVNANDTAVNANNMENANRQSDAEITGKVPEALRKEGNVFFNADGTLKNPEWDFQAIINEATARGDMETVRQAEEARLWKVQNVDGFEEYASTVKVPEAQQTEAGRQFDEDVRLSEEGNELVKQELEADAEIEREKIAVEREKTAAELYAEAAQYEAMGMGDVAEGLRRYADGKGGSADGVDSGAESGGAAEGGTTQSEKHTANMPPRAKLYIEPSLEEGYSKGDIYENIMSDKTLTAAEKVQAMYEAGLKDEEIELLLKA